MFRNEHQRAEVCNALTYFIRHRELFTCPSSSPRDTPLAGYVCRDARALMRTPLSTGERVMLRFALQVWRVGGIPISGSKLDVSELLHSIDGKNMRLVGSLIVALGGSVRALDDWLASNSVARQQERNQDAGDADAAEASDAFDAEYDATQRVVRATQHDARVMPACVCGAPTYPHRGMALACGPVATEEDYARKVRG